MTKQNAVYLWDSKYARTQENQKEHLFFNAPDIHSNDVRNTSYKLVDELICFSRSNFWVKEWSRESIDLLEVGRIAFIFYLFPAVRNWLAWEYLKKKNITNVTIIAPSELETVLIREGRQHEIEVIFKPDSALISNSTATPIHRRVWLGVRNRLKIIKRIIKTQSASYLQPPYPNQDRRRVLFLDHSPNSTEILIPIWKQLVNFEKDQVLYVAGNESVYSVLKKVGINALNIQKCLPASSVMDVKTSHWKNFIDDFINERWIKDFAPCTKSLHQSLYSLVSLIKTTEMVTLRLQNLFKRFKPDVVVTSTHASLEARSSHLLALKDQVRSLHIQHGMYEGGPTFQNSLADVSCLWGQLHKDVLSAYPGHGELIVTGSAKHDSLLDSVKQVTQNHKPLIVKFCSRVGGNAINELGYKKHLKAVYRTAAKLNEYDFVVKIHPGDKLETIIPMIEDLPTLVNFRITETDDSYRLIKQSSVVIVYSSTIGFEALLFERRLVILDLVGKRDWLSMIGNNYTKRVTSENELVDVIQQEVKLRYTMSAPRDFIWLADGRACERIVNLMKN